METYLYSFQLPFSEMMFKTGLSLPRTNRQLSENGALLLLVLFLEFKCKMRRFKALSFQSDADIVHPFGEIVKLILQHP